MGVTTLPGAVRPYLANALDQIGQVRARFERGEELFGVFEDDLMLTSDDAGTARERIEVSQRCRSMHVRVL